MNIAHIKAEDEVTPNLANSKDETLLGVITSYDNLIDKCRLRGLYIIYCLAALVTFMHWTVYSISYIYVLRQYEYIERRDIWFMQNAFPNIENQSFIGRIV